MAEAADDVEMGRLTMEIRLERCEKLWKPWRRALVVKVLGKNFSFRLLEKRLTDLWGRGNPLDIVDLDRGFFVVRFFFCRTVSLFFGTRSLDDPRTLYNCLKMEAFLQH